MMVAIHFKSVGVQPAKLMGFWLTQFQGGSWPQILADHGNRVMFFSERPTYGHAICPFIVDFPIKNCDFPITNGDLSRCFSQPSK